MRLSPRLRGALALTLLASLGVAFLDTPADTAVQAVTTARRPATPAASAAAGSTAWPASPTRAAVSAWPDAGAHALAAWLPMAPPATPPASAPPRVAMAVPAAPPPPPAPVAPPFPYQLIGRVDDSGASQALLLGATQTLGVRAGDVVEGQWRIETIGATGVTLTWIPAGLRQTLTFRPS